MSSYEVNGFYGGSQTPCTVFVYVDGGRYWYCVEDSVNVNATYEFIGSDVNIEQVEDVDAFTWSSPIESLDELVKAVES